MGQVVICIPQINKENIMKERRKWDDSQSPQWKYFQENERKEKKNEKKLDIWPKIWYNIGREWREIANPAPLKRHVSETEEVNASPPQVSIERILNGIHRLGEVRFLSRLPNYRKDPAPTEEARRTCWDNDSAPTEETWWTCWVNKLNNIKPPNKKKEFVVNVDRIK